MKRFLIILQFFTTIPVSVDVEFTAEDFGRGIIYIPFIGAIIGFFLLGIHYLSSLLSSDTVSAVFTVIGGVIITGGLHLDGLADTFDGIFSYRPKEKMLEIMKDPRLGTFGGMALFFLLLLKIIFLLSISKILLGKAIFVMPLFGRLGMIWCAGISEYAREKSGMGSATIDFAGFREIVICTGITILIAFLAMGSSMIVPLATTIVFTLIFTKFIYSKIGGTTGDILGACTEISEILLLFTILVMEKLSLITLMQSLF
ncbi:MAG: adenosylcobinamide-GDP ribazoletransferase [Candidatus Eremiobacterota bacterium]